MNGEANCILEVCCPADEETNAATPSAHAALAKHLCDECDLSPVDAAAVTTYIYKHFDLAERGTLRAFKASIARVLKLP